MPTLVALGQHPMMRCGNISGRNITLAQPGSPDGAAVNSVSACGFTRCLGNCQRENPSVVGTDGGFIAPFYKLNWVTVLRPCQLASALVLEQRAFVFREMRLSGWHR